MQIQIFVTIIKKGIYFTLEILYFLHIIRKKVYTVLIIGQK